MHISWFRDIGLADRPTVGGKGGSLGELQRAGIDVPPGFVVRTSAFEEYLAALEQLAPVRARVAQLAADDLEGMRAAARELRSRFDDTPMPEALAQQILAAYAALGEAGRRVIVAVAAVALTRPALLRTQAYKVFVPSPSESSKARGCEPNLGSSAAGGPAELSETIQNVGSAPSGYKDAAEPTGQNGPQQPEAEEAKKSETEGKDEKAEKK